MEKIKYNVVLDTSKKVTLKESYIITLPAQRKQLTVGGYGKISNTFSVSETRQGYIFNSSQLRFADEQSAENWCKKAYSAGSMYHIGKSNKWHDCYPIETSYGLAYVSEKYLQYRIDNSAHPEQSVPPELIIVTPVTVSLPDSVKQFLIDNSVIAHEYYSVDIKREYAGESYHYIFGCLKDSLSADTPSVWEYSNNRRQEYVPIYFLDSNDSQMSQLTNDLNNITSNAPSPYNYTFETASFEGTDQFLKLQFPNYKFYQSRIQGSPLSFYVKLDDVMKLYQRPSKKFDVEQALKNIVKK